MSSNNDSIWFMTAACSNTFSISPSLQGPISCSLENRRQFTNDFGEGNRRAQLCGAFVSQVSGDGSGQSICLFPAEPVPPAGRDASGSHTAGVVGRRLVRLSACATIDPPGQFGCFSRTVPFSPVAEICRRQICGDHSRLVVSNHARTVRLETPMVFWLAIGAVFEDGGCRCSGFPEHQEGPR